MTKDQLTAEDYEEVLADHRRLVRELDVLLNGEHGAAKQASLCDIVGQLKRQKCAPSSKKCVYCGREDGKHNEVCLLADNQRLRAERDDALEILSIALPGPRPWPTESNVAKLRIYREMALDKRRSADETTTVQSAHREGSEPTSRLVGDIDWCLTQISPAHKVHEVLSRVARQLAGSSEEPNGNQADSASSGADAAAPMPRGSLPNSLGAFPEKTSSELCGARWEMADRVNIYCTLPKGHAAQHEAWGTTGLFHAWSAVNGDERNDG